MQNARQTASEPVHPAPNPFLLVFSVRTVFFFLTTNQLTVFFSRLISTAEHGLFANADIYTKIFMEKILFITEKQFKQTG
jgi:hypothetical protein